MRMGECGAGIWILVSLAGGVIAGGVPAGPPLLASGVATELPWWMWLLPVLAVAIPAAMYGWRHRPRPPASPPGTLAGGPEEPGEAADPFFDDDEHPGMHFAS